MARSEDMGDYYRIRSDSRDLDYQKYRQYFSEGDLHDMDQEDYTSHNTTQLTVEETKELVAGLPEVQAELEGWEPSRCILPLDCDTNRRDAGALRRSA